jgi:putative tricarboxylic transport membrane protein
VPYKILFPMILLFCVIGAYSVSNQVFDVYLMLGFGVLGWLMKKYGFEPAPLVLAFVLGPMLENNLRKSLILSRGDFMTFLERPISAVCLGLALLLLISPLLPMFNRQRKQLATEES